jgi:UDP-glucuronate 4-epimerase
VICLDNFDSFYAPEIKHKNISQLLLNPNFKLVEADIRNNTLLAELFKNNSIDIVIHLAAKAGVRPSILNPKEYVDVNITGTMNLLENMRIAGVKNLIFSSSSSVYGNNEKIPYAESDNVDYPISPYAATKKSGELLTFNYHHLNHFNIINLRFFTVFGPRQRPDLAIHKFFDRLYSNQSIEMYGDGSTSRDYTYVDDIVVGIAGAIEFIASAKSSMYEIINLGNSNPVKLSELIQFIEEVTGKKFTIQKLPMQEGDVNLTFADITKAKTKLNYAPKTSIIEGLRKFKNWYEGQSK